MDNIITKNFIVDGKLTKHTRFMIRCSLPFFDILWKIALIWARITTQQRPIRKYYFSICAIFNNESLILKEFIEYHKLVGVDHIYLYNNFSTDNSEEIIKPYVEQGFITLTNCWSAKIPIVEIQNHFHNKYWNETRWCAFIDLDEFICPKYELNVKDWIKKYENYPSVVIYWKIFGSNGQLEHDNNKLISEQYINSCDRFYDIGKSIFNTRFDVYKQDIKTIHVLPASIRIFGIKFMIPPINEFKKFVYFKYSRLGLKCKEDFTIQINHYTTKSYTEYFQMKIKRGDAGGNKKRLNIYNYLFHNHNCNSCDYTIYRFMVELKLKIYSNKVNDYFN